jgi:hypothetical protein
MSLPCTGRFEAQLSGWRLSFDGETWTCPEADFGQLCGPALARATVRNKRQHLTVDEIGAACLDDVFPGRDWTEIAAEADGWTETLDPGAVD